MVQGLVLCVRSVAPCLGSTPGRAWATLWTGKDEHVPALLYCCSGPRLKAFYSLGPEICNIGSSRSSCEKPSDAVSSTRIYCLLTAFLWWGDHASLLLS